MNRFISSILTFMFGWLRRLISSLWRAIDSEDGGLFFRFLNENWKMLVLVLCISGVVVDFIIYLIRWRPHYVWFKKPLPGAAYLQEPIEEEPIVSDPQPEPVPWSEPTPVPEAAVAAPAVKDDMVQVLFDDPALNWEQFEAPAPSDPSQPRSRRRSTAYYRDVQAGYARPVPSEEFYSARPVHPGLNEEVFRQNVGLANEPIAQVMPQLEPMPEPPQPISAPDPYAAFHPFTETTAAPAQQASRLNRLMKRARNLMSTAEDDNRTIHDLQTTVDVSQAFHEPVYPQRSEDDIR